MIPAIHKLIALQDKAMALTARLAVARMIAPEAPAAAIRARVWVMSGSCRNQRPQKIRTSFSRQWTGPGFLRAAMALEIEAAMEVLAVVVEAVAVAQTVEVAGVAALAARRAPGSCHPAAMFRGSKHPDAGMAGMTGITGAIETIAVGAATAIPAARALISRIR